MAMVKGIIGGNDFFTEMLVRGLTINGPADAYCVGHCSEQLGSRLEAKYGVRFLRNIFDFIPNSAVLFLIFSPEDESILLPKIAEKLKEWTLIISLVQDLKLDTLEYFFPNNEIIRFVCNPAVVSGKGLGAYVVGSKGSTDAKTMAEIILKDCGDIIKVKDEEEFQKVSNFIAANSFLADVVIQTMIKSARKIGMTQKEAQFAVDKILKGAVHTLIETDNETANLIYGGLNDKYVKDRMLELIKDYGLDVDLLKRLHEESSQKVDPNDDPSNYRMHYQWSR